MRMMGGGGSTRPSTAGVSVTSMAWGKVRSSALSQASSQAGATRM